MAIIARWNGTIIAQSDDTVMVEGNHYFPPEDVRREFLEPSKTTSFCPWKGKAQYYSIKVADTTNRDSAWYYSDPKPAAEEIRGRIAFWKGVEILDA